MERNDWLLKQCDIWRRYRRPPNDKAKGLSTRRSLTKFSKSWLDLQTEKEVEACMRAIVSNITAAMLLIHAMVGCCRHHECHAASCDGALEKVCPTDGCCHRNHPPCDRPTERPHRPANCTFGCQGVCTYVPPEKTLVEKPHSTIALDFLPADPALADSSLVTAGSLWESTDCGPAPGLPLRLHLMHQILLV
jgi:hypothetical protein